MTNDGLDPALNPDLDRVSRRAIIEKMSMSTIAAAILGPEAMGQGKTPDALNDKTLVHEDVVFPIGGEPIQAFLCRSKGDAKRGAVIVVHEIFGLNDHIRDVTCRFAKAGFDGLAVNFFQRGGKLPETSGDFRPLMEYVNKIPDSQIMGDVAAAASYLRHRSDSNGKVGIVGFCWGGRVSMLAAANGAAHLNAAVAYYGRIKGQPSDNQPHSPLDLAAEMNAPLLGNFGEKDQGITPDVPALREALEKNHKTAELYVYEGAGHAFNNDTRPSYHEPSAKLAWQRTLAWFDKYVKG